MLDWTRAVVTIRVFREELRESLLPERRAELEASGHGAYADAFARACHINGVSTDEAVEAIEADIVLFQLAEATLLEVIVGTPDPGPYDIISRESPSGTPENLHFGAFGAAAVNAPVTLAGPHKA